jgi:hypothetical protein
MSGKIIKWWHKMTVWDKIERTLGLVGAGAVTEMAVHEVPYGWFIIVGICGLLSKLVLIWIQDNDGDGIADIFI